MQHDSIDIPISSVITDVTIHQGAADMMNVCELS
jgi:hypothetical protein